jgi:ankyrin repeat protein
MKKTDLTWNEENRQYIEQLEAIFFKNADTLSYQLTKRLPLLKGIFNFFGLKTELEKETDKSVIQQKLQDNQINLNIADHRGFTPLIVAAQENNVELIKSILQVDSNVNRVDAYGKTALHWAATNGNPEIVELLIKHGADVNTKDLSNQKALYYAKTKNTQEKIKLLGVKIRKLSNKKTVDLLKTHTRTNANHADQEKQRKNIGLQKER